ncbi:hypothetical protein M408DRAFT_18900 [Serendipita vermifera MAFF 305830]|uniref:MARVEL domain-containing protein n=1 Tax=Serendipita vermifera MAFF 305830 TaxID=933852 RepID=A0A0C2X763_SERVB|nr:hypothetical protein M408DRAFT_18900 [Serendipita vermifera MAFF 305830]
MATAAVRNRTIVKGLLALVTIIVLALSTHINLFMGFFYIADRFPFVMSIITLFTLFITSVLDAMKGGDIVTSRPMTEIGILGVFFIIWTAANGFSTPRWDAIQPGTCSAITVANNPTFESATRMWCREMIALRAFVWIEWVIVGGALAALVTFCVNQSRRGSRHVWSTPLSIYDPNMAAPNKWNANSRVFSQFSFYTPGDLNTPYPFAPQDPSRKPVTPRADANPNTLSVMSHESGPALMGYQLDPFNVPKERPISLASSGEGAVQPVSWRTFTEQGFDGLGHRTKGDERSHQERPHHGYSTSVDHHPSQAYPGQAYPTQAYPYPTQAYPNQAYPSQAYPSQAYAF